MDRKLLLLGILRRQEMHGYQLHEFINNNLASCTDMKKSTAYYLLKQMEEAGFISQETVQKGNRPPRQVYQIMPVGEAEFQRLLRENLSENGRVYFTDDIGLVFLNELEAEEAITLLKQRRAKLAERLDGTQVIPAHKGSLQLVFDHLLHHLTSELAWLDSVIQQVTEGN